MNIPKFYPIAPNYETAKIYILAGVKFLQIRIKEMPLENISYQLQETLTLSRFYKCSLVINDYWELAIQHHASWIHLGQEDLERADIQAIKKSGIKIGISTHDRHELDIALDIQPDYIALGPVYFTQLKAMKWQPQGLNKVTEWKKHIGDIPLVAIGGITLENADDVLNAGADSVSFVTDITRHEKPEQRLIEWLKKFSG
jgi:thiamine-phosphate pyrophosphorylase